MKIVRVCFSVKFYLHNVYLFYTLNKTKFTASLNIYLVIFYIVSKLINK